MAARFEALKSAPASFKGLHKLHEFPRLRRRAALEPVVKSHLADSHHPAGGLNALRGLEGVERGQGGRGHTLP